MSSYIEYANNVINGDIIAGEYIDLACQRFLNWLQREDIEFRPEKVDKVIKFISKLKHFTGSHNGKPFILQPWQEWVVANIYGFYWKDTNERVTKNAYIEVARKNGKSAFAAALCLYALIADGENNSEVELIANSRKQAGICFDMCANFIRTLDPKHKLFRSYRDKIKFDKTKSFLQVLSSDSGNNDGWNSYMYVADEAHSYPDSKMYDVMKSSQGMRDNPLALVITTAGLNLYSFCYNMRQTNIEVLRNIKQDDTQFTAIYTLDEGDDWEDSKNWIKANPNMGITVKENYLREQIQQAKNNPSLETSIRTKNFNQWLATSEIWVNNDLLLKASSPISLEDMNNLQIYMGVDLSSVSDLTSVSGCWLLDGKYHFKTWYFLPESALQNNSNAEMYKDWKRQGLLNITAGNVVDYDYILSTIMTVNNHCYIQKIAYDSWNATQWAITATAQGLPLEPFSQALWHFNRATKGFERLIKSGQVVMDDNPITRWCFSNCVLKYDHNQNCKPVKSGDNQQKIDGVIAMLQAFGVLIEEPFYQNEIFSV